MFKRVNLLALLILILCSCTNKEESSIELVELYWSSLKSNDAATLQKISFTPEEESGLSAKKNKGGKFIKLISSSFSFIGDLPVIVKTVPSGIEVKFSQYCYPDTTIITYLVETKGGEIKVDHHATQMSLVRVLSRIKTNKKYCNEFKNVAMTGSIAGKIWNPGNFTEIDFLGRTAHEILSKSCTESIKCTHLTFFNLDIDSDGGNFGDRTRINLFSPPSNNNNTLGSFRITSIDKEHFKLEISIYHDEKNFIEGYLLVDRNNLVAYQANSNHQVIPVSTTRESHD